MLSRVTTFFHYILKQALCTKLFDLQKRKKFLSTTTVNCARDWNVTGRQIRKCWQYWNKFIQCQQSSNNIDSITFCHCKCICHMHIYYSNEEYFRFQFLRVCGNLFSYSTTLHKLNWTKKYRKYWFSNTVLADFLDCSCRTIWRSEIRYESLS